MLDKDCFVQLFEAAAIAEKLLEKIYRFGENSRIEEAYDEDWRTCLTVIQKLRPALEKAKVELEKKEC